MAIIAKYKFNPSLYADYLPTFNKEFTGYIKTDVTNSDGTITRTISHDTLKPTFMRFGVSGSSATDREKSLLEVIECDTSQVTSMVAMFQNCSSLTTLDLSNFNTSNVTSMVAMFQNCSSLTTLDLSNFNTSNVTSMGDMFKNCSKLTLLDLSSFNTSNVTAMNSMFGGCASITTLVLSNFDTSKVTSMWGIFYNCSSLTTLDLSNFNTSNVTSMANMFNSCNKLISLDLSSFDTSKVTGMGGMFGGCSVTDVGLLYATSSTINTLLTHLGTSVARNIYYIDAPLNELTVQNNITYKEYKITKATLPYTLNKLPNGVADYIDVVNKVHVQRVGIATVIGDNMRTVGTVGADDYRFEIANALDVNITSGWWGTVGTDLLYTHSSVRSVRGYNKSVILYPVNRNITLADFQTVLQANPVTVLYPLSTPIYTPLTNEEIAQLPLSAYKDGYINLSSDQLTPSFEFRMRASNRYQVDMLETGYYYLNAPVGNVRLGTANVDVQQMPCIVKVDNVGTGDSGYRLGFNGGNTSILSFDKSNFTLGYYYGLSGELLASGRDCAYEEYIPISTGDSILINQLYYTQANPYSVSVILYDSNKTMIKQLQISKATPQKVNTANVAYFRFSCIHDRTVTEPTTKVAEVYINPITLAKLPSHRIPTSFTQGMKCTTDFGYWEGIKVVRPYSFRTRNTSGASVEEQLLTNIPELYRIEYNNTIVEDEFDVAIGKLTKRIEKVTLNGSENWSYNASGNNAKTRAYQSNLTKQGNGYVAFSDKLPFSAYWSNDKSRVWLDGSGARIVVHLPHEIMYNVDNFKQYLASNPLTIYYELAVPEISYISLSANQVKTVANSTIIQSSKYNELYLTPQVKPSYLTYPVPSLVGNRTYTVVHNRKNITGSTKPITLDLGGTQVELNDASSKTLVKTPSSLKHNSLIFTGGESTVDHIMVLDGDWTNKPIEYFENMKGHDTDAIITIIGDGKIDDVAEQYLW